MGSDWGVSYVCGCGECGAVLRHVCSSVHSVENGGASPTGRTTAFGVADGTASPREATGEVLMMAWMNEEAVQRTIDTRKVTYWSRSRQSFWVKGETSGNVQQLIDLRMDCDKDCLLALVKQTGPACHTNRRSCFYTSVSEGSEIELMSPE